MNAARANWQSMIKADREQRDKVKEFMQVLRQALLVAFAGLAETLEDFGLTVRKELCGWAVVTCRPRSLIRC